MSEKEFRLTNQRKIIMDYLKNNYSHPTVEDIFLNVKKKLPQISKKTVYSNLQFLCSQGFIQEAKIKGFQRYEPTLKEHNHLICRKCGKIEDLDSDDLVIQAMNIGKKSRNFDVDSVSINFYGICRKCKGGK